MNHYKFWVTTALLTFSQYSAAIGYTYDNLNRLTAVSYDNGSTVAYSYDAAGNMLSTLTSTPPDPSAPTVPTGLSASGVSATQINLSWTAATDNVGVTTYKVYRGGTLLATLGNVTSYSNTGLTASTAYSYTVAACDAAGNCSAQSSAALTSTLGGTDTTAPTVPVALTATSVSASQINLTWAASTDSTGVTSYKVYRAGLLVSTVGNITSFSNTGLTASTAYSYAVSACDAAGNCSALSLTASASTLASGSSGGTLNVAIGWNLLGNSNNAPLTVASAFGNAANVATVWKWLPATSKWAFYTPSLADGGAAYAATKGYDLLTTINAGEGFWVNAVSSFSATLPVGTAVTSSSFASMPAGWRLAAVGDNPTPLEFNNALGMAPPTPGQILANLTSLWAWDSSSAKWYFYAPSLDAQGGTALADYISSKGHKDFTTNGKKLEPNTGFWLNRP